MRILCGFLAALCALTALTVIWPDVGDRIRAPWWAAFPLLGAAVVFAALGMFGDR
jgi:hypothetical protein